MLHVASWHSSNVASDDVGSTLVPFVIVHFNIASRLVPSTGRQDFGFLSVGAKSELRLLPDSSRSSARGFYAESVQRVSEMVPVKLIFRTRSTSLGFNRLTTQLAT